MRNVLFIFCVALSFIGCGTNSIDEHTSPPKKPRNSEPKNPKDSDPSSSVPKTASAAEWDMVKWPDLWKPIRFPKELFLNIASARTNAAEYVRRLAIQQDFPWKIVVVRTVPMNHRTNLVWKNFLPVAGENFSDFFNSAKGLKCTPWSDPRKTGAPAGFFLSPTNLRLPADEDESIGSECESPNVAAGFVLLSEGATLETVLHESLHGFYAKTIWADFNEKEKKSVFEIQKSREALLESHLAKFSYLGESDPMVLWIKLSLKFIQLESTIINFANEAKTFEATKRLLAQIEGRTERRIPFSAVGPISEATKLLDELNALEKKITNEKNLKKVESMRNWIREQIAAMDRL